MLKYVKILNIGFPLCLTVSLDPANIKKLLEYKKMLKILKGIKNFMLKVSRLTVSINSSSAYHVVSETIHSIF